MIAGSYRWWTLHPWITWWVTLAVLIGGWRVLPIGAAWGPVVAALTLFAATTFLVGLCVSFRKSLWRGLLITAAAVALVLAIVVPLYTNLAPRARMAKAQADVRQLAEGVSFYRNHMGRLPAALDDLTRPATDPRGRTVRAFLDQVPLVPAGYAPYRYEPRPDGTFTISGAGDGVTVKAP